MSLQVWLSDLMLLLAVSKTGYSTLLCCAAYQSVYEYHYHTQAYIAKCIPLISSYHVLSTWYSM